MKTQNFKANEFLVFELNQRAELCKVIDKPGNIHGCFVKVFNKKGDVIKHFKSFKPDITFVPFNLLKLPTPENIIKVNKYHKNKSNVCPQCGSELIHTEGCDRCFNCGWSSCNL